MAAGAPTVKVLPPVSVCFWGGGVRGAALRDSESIPADPVLGGGARMTCIDVSVVSG